MSDDASFPILQNLEYEKVFSIEKLANGNFMVGEECDSYFGVELTRGEMVALSKEILSLANGEGENDDEE